MELSEEIYDKITLLSEEGDVLLEHGKTEDAIAKYEEALSLVPNPKTDWEASTWLNTALGDSCFIQKEYEKALNYYFNAYKCPGGIDNPYINLMLGETYFELKDLNKAKEFLLRAYMLEGKALFEDEKEDYLKLIAPLI